MTYLCFAGFLGFCGHIVFIKLCYFKHEAVCLDWSRASRSFFTIYPLYEYILVEKNKIVTYQRSGITIFKPKNVKKPKKTHKKTGYCY